MVVDAHFSFSFSFIWLLSFAARRLPKIPERETHVFVSAAYNTGETRQIKLIVYR